MSGPERLRPPPPVCPSTSPLLGTCREPGHAGAEPPRVTGQPQQGLHLCLAFCEFRIQRLPADNETELWSPAEGPGHPEAGCFRKGEEGGVPGRGRLGPEASPACASSHPEAGMGTSRGAPPGPTCPSCVWAALRLLPLCPCLNAPSDESRPFSGALETWSLRGRWRQCSRGPLPGGLGLPPVLTADPVVDFLPPLPMDRGPHCPRLPAGSRPRESIRAACRGLSWEGALARRLPPATPEPSDPG